MVAPTPPGPTWGGGNVSLTKNSRKLTRNHVFLCQLEKTWRHYLPGGRPRIGGKWPRIGVNGPYILTRIPVNWPEIRFSIFKKKESEHFWTLKPQFGPNKSSGSCGTNSYVPNFEDVKKSGNMKLAAPLAGWNSGSVQGFPSKVLGNECVSQNHLEVEKYRNPD